MKKRIDESDFIGGDGALTKEEEVSLSIYFAKKRRGAGARSSKIVSETIVPGKPINKSLLQD